MIRYVLPFPVQPGKSESDVKGLANLFSSRPAEYQESRRRAGVTLERAYLQKTPMGNFVVMYVEGTKSYMETLQALMDRSLDINQRFIDHLKDVHGMDETQPPPAPENVIEWADPEVMTRQRGLAFLAPEIPGTEDAGRAFGREASVTRLAEFTASRRALKQNLEIVTLLETPMGPIIAVYLEGEDPIQGNATFAASQQPFDRWFKDECKKLFPPEVNFDEPLPPVEEVFDSQAVLAKA